MFMDASLDHVLFGTSSGDIGGSTDGFRINAEGNVLSGMSETGTFTYNYYGDRRGSNNEGIIYGLAMNVYFKSSISVLGQSNSSDNGGITFDTISGNSTKTERMRITPSETVINETSNDHDFRVESNNYDHAFHIDAGSDDIRMGGNNASPWGQGSGQGTWQYKIAEQSAQISTDSATGYANLYLNKFNITADDNRLISFYVNGGAVGTVRGSTSGVTYNTTSDRRLKDNIQPIADATDKLMDMKPVTHTWIDNPDEPQVHGFIAQEMQEVVPEAVSGDAESDEMMSMDYGRITPVIVAALQDALKEIKELKTRIDELENN